MNRLSLRENYASYQVKVDYNREEILGKGLYYGIDIKTDMGGN